MDINNIYIFYRCIYIIYIYIVYDIKSTYIHSRKSQEKTLDQTYNDGFQDLDQQPMVIYHALLTRDIHGTKTTHACGGLTF